MPNLGVNFSLMIYEPNQDVFSVDVDFNPVVSGGTGYVGRGIFATRSLMVQSEAGSLYSDQETILDILESEFPVLPMQGDRLTIPKDCNGVNQGEWEVIDKSTNGGGETTLVLRKWEGS
jgi:hypothetical protein